MSLITLGLNHKTTPVNMRERLAFTPENLAAATQSLANLDCVTEAAILSTCNRTELYCTVKQGDDAQNDRQIIEWFSQFHGFKPDDIREHLYLHQHEETIRHALSVASGLDSMVLGEPQILGQMKQAYTQAVNQGTIGMLLGKLFQHAFSVAKQVRTDTAIGASAVSVAFAAVALSKQIFGDLNELTALMIGAGETIELAGRHLKASNIKHIIIANRSVDRAQNLVEQLGGEAIALAQIPDYLHQADILISSTASQLPILGKGAVEKALKKRKHKPIFMVDIAVPRDVEPEVAELDDVYLYTVDDLQEIIQDNMASRKQAAEQAIEIIDAQVDNFLNWQRTLEAVDVIREMRDCAEHLTNEVMDKALKQLAQGKSTEETMQFLAHTLMNKFLHQPSIQLRQAGQDSRHDLIEFARQLFLGRDANKTEDTN
ncbi:MAG: glutamyl-tRNA reductase [Gammaproteobacteria bacterium]|nr:glutamyl-tRNA reductase [Gammaproteobacteria bacterium]MDH5735133.1 glutamyl-tRNA reductase [Gammaproteobacteria bacterium]